jgi:hypothetical protein
MTKSSAYIQPDGSSRLMYLLGIEEGDDSKGTKLQTVNSSVSVSKLVLFAARLPPLLARPDAVFDMQLKKGRTCLLVRAAKIFCV